MFSKKIMLTVFLSVAMAVGVPVGKAADHKTKVGFVYVGPIGDHGWSYQHNVGRLAIENAYGDKVKTTYVESVKYGADSERVITKLARSGHKLIFTTSFGYMNPTQKVAKRFPKVKFEHATGYKRSKNVSTYSGRFYEGRHVVGLIAGKMTKSNIIGYVASYPIPEVIRGINATFLAARSVNPNIKIKIIWVYTWFDPGKEADAAKALIAQGADVIMQHTDSPAPLQQAQKANVWAVGQASDMAAFGPKAQLTAIIDDWNAYYIQRTKAMLDGNWKSQDEWGGFKSGMVKMAPYNKAIPAEVVAMAEKAKEGIFNGTVHPFTGPIKDQKGKIRVPAGQKADDVLLGKMNFYVEGIDATIPKSK